MKKSARIVAWLCGLVAIASAFWYIQQSYTPPIPNITEAGSIAELVQIEAQGRKQYLVIRGTNKTSPLLLVIHGGPGTPLTPLMRKHNAELEEDFVVVYWEQAGAGKSFVPFMELRPFTLERYVEEARTVSEYLLKRFNRDSLILMGHSWGSLIGLQTAYKYPHLFRVFIGVGQNIDLVRQEALAYKFTLNEARKSKDHEALKTLQRIGPPEKGRYKGGEESIRAQRSLLSRYNGDSTRYNIEEAYTEAVIQCAEYSWLEKALFSWAISESLHAAEKDLKPFNAFDSVPSLSIPAFFISGRRDANAALELVREYIEYLHAPKKELIVLEHSAHYPMLDQPTEFRETLKKIVEATGE